MAHTQHTETQVDPKIGQLKAILYLLQTNLEEFQQEVDRSYELLKVGEKTKFSQDLEALFDNPLAAVFQSSYNIDQVMKVILSRFVQSLLKTEAELIEQAYKVETPSGDLHFAIVLKDDKLGNRSKVFEVLEPFDLSEISLRYPIRFQFVPKHLISKIKIIEPELISN